MILFDQQVLYIGIYVQFSFGFLCGSGDGLVDCVYVVDCMVLCIFYVIVLVEYVVQQYVGIVWCIWVCVVVDDVIEVEQCFDWFVFELVVQVFGC